jgi:2-keto-4-pentenoate hydratase/2-oxohepta-3-ene-1,7-dioic acid hydratase in catechol pathway
MKLVTIQNGDIQTAGCIVGDDILDLGLASHILSLPGDAVATVSEILDFDCSGGDQARDIFTSFQQADAEALAKLRTGGALVAFSDIILAAPLPRPTTLFSHGQAYHSHARDWNPNAPVDKPKVPPAGFLKALTSITGSGQPIRLPRIAADMVDFEGEFCVVFGRDCHQISRREAMHHVAGYTIINDVSARDWIPAMRTPIDATPQTYAALNMMFKNFPTFCPMGPCVVTKDEIGDYHDLALITRLNGEVMQHASIRDLIWDIPELIEYYSLIYAFKAGDVLSTGTPGGVGMGRDPWVFLRAGDRIDVEVTGVGTLSNTVIGPE